LVIGDRDRKHTFASSWFEERRGASVTRYCHTPTSPGPSSLSTQVLVQKKKKNKSRIFIQYFTFISTYLNSNKFQKSPCALRSDLSTQAVPPVVQAREKGMGMGRRGVRGKGGRKEGRRASGVSRHVRRHLYLGSYESE
jgi:hypothetical protein